MLNNVDEAAGYATHALSMGNVVVEPSKSESKLG
jgi:hypothetical protein